MSRIRRVFLLAVEAGGAEQIALSQEAEAAGWDGVWISGGSASDPDSYAMVVAAGTAAVTTDLRIGVVVTLSRREDTLRLAEDLGVLDNCSSGRAELYLRAGGGQVGFWENADRLLAQVRECEASGRPLMVTPGTVQPVLPVLADDILAPTRADIGRVVELAERIPLATDAQGRFAVLVGPESVAALYRASFDPETLEPAVRAIREAADVVGAEDVVLSVAGGDAPDRVTRLGAVVAPVLRANEDELRDLFVDTVRFHAAVQAIYEPE